MTKLAGCAIMLLTEPIELDLTNQGNRFVGRLSYKAPGLAAFIGSVVTEWRKLVSDISQALASERKHRETIERELFGGRYMLSSKNDDDLPVVHWADIGTFHAMVNRAYRILDPR